MITRRLIAKRFVAERFVAEYLSARRFLARRRTSEGREGRPATVCSGRGLSWALGLCGALILSWASPTPAVDTPGQAPDYLDRKIRPQWRLTALTEALSEIGEEIEKPVAISSAIEDEDPELVLIEDTKSSVREILELLERTHDLHFVAEPLRLVARTGAEHRRLQRKLVNLNLRDYGLFFRPKSQQPTVIVRSYDEAGGGASPFGGFDDEEDDGLPFDFEELIESLTSEGGDSEAQIRGKGNLMLFVTPQEEARLRRNLDQVYETIVRRSAWRVHFGWLDGEARTPGGILPSSRVAAIAGRLEEPVVLAATAMTGQRITATQARYQRVVDDAEVNQTGRVPVLNPVVRGVSRGRAAHLCPHVGLESTLLVFEAEWVEHRPGVQRQKVRVPATLAAPRLTTSTTAGKGDSTVTRSELSPAQLDAGLTLTLEHHAVWEWKPRGEVYLPRQHGLVLTAPGGERQRVIVIEEVR